MTDRDRVLGRLPHGNGSPLPPPFALAGSGREDLWSAFESRLSALGGRLVAWRDLADLPDRDWCLDLCGEAPPAVAGEFTSAPVWEASVGVCRGELAVAETGSVLIVHKPWERRLASLAPPHNVIVLRQRQIVDSLDEAFVSLPSGNATLVTGPSRTADIEGTLVRGVHGPRDLWVVVETD